MNPKTFLLLNVVLGFYNVGTIWAHEVDIFRSWKLVGTARFHEVQRVHWRKIPYWVLMPVGLAFCGSVALLWYHPAGSPIWGIWGVFLCQALSLILTAIFWGPLAGKTGARSPRSRKRLPVEDTPDALGPNLPHQCCRSRFAGVGHSFDLTRGAVAATFKSSAAFPRCAAARSPATSPSAAPPASVQSQFRPPSMDVE